MSHKGQQAHSPIYSSSSCGTPPSTTAATTTGTATTTTTPAAPAPPPNPSPRGTLRELLRTRYAAPGTTLLVEAVDTGYTSATKRWRTIRLLLGDGELCVQALLGVGLHRYVDTGEVGVGTYLRLEEFGIGVRSLASASAGAGATGAGGGNRAGVRSRKDAGGMKEGKSKVAGGKMVCLIVESMVPVGCDRRLVAMAKGWRSSSPSQAGSGPPEGRPDEAEGQRTRAGRPSTPPVTEIKADIASGAVDKSEIVEDTHSGRTGSLDQFEMDAQEEDETRPVATAAAQRASLKTTDLGIDEDDDDDIDDDFEVMSINQGRTHTQQHRGGSTHDAITRYPDQLRQPDLKTLSTREPRQQTTTQPTSTTTTTTKALPKPPIKLTQLKSIPTLPYKQNWSVNVLAVVSAITPLEPASLPPSYAQRQVRLTDPTTPKHVLLTVFLDPEVFEPEVGSVVLLLGVKNHTFDGGSLKKYASDRPKGGFGGDLTRVLASAGAGGGNGTEQRGNAGQWWFENPVQFAWCDVAGLKSWWTSQS